MRDVSLELKAQFPMRVNVISTKKSRPIQDKKQMQGLQSFSFSAAQGSQVVTEDMTHS